LLKGAIKARYYSLWPQSSSSSSSARASGACGTMSIGWPGRQIRPSRSDPSVQQGTALAMAPRARACPHQNFDEAIHSAADRALSPASRGASERPTPEGAQEEGRNKSYSRRRSLPAGQAATLLNPVIILTFMLTPRQFNGSFVYRVRFKNSCAPRLARTLVRPLNHDFVFARICKSFTVRRDADTICIRGHT